LAPSDKHRPAVRRGMVALEKRFSGRVLSISDEIILRWGAITGELKRLTGHSASFIDSRLTASAIENDL
jgi:toxin FitB